MSKKKNKAPDDSKQVLKKNPADMDALWRVTMHYIKHCEHRLATKILRQAVTAGSGGVQIHYLQGRVHALAEDWEACIQAYREGTAGTF